MNPDSRGKELAFYSVYDAIIQVMVNEEMQMFAVHSNNELDVNYNSMKQVSK